MRYLGGTFNHPIVPLMKSSIRVFALAGIAAFALACNSAPKDVAKPDSAVKPAVGATSSGVTQAFAAHEVEVVGLDYAFSMPDSLDAGRTAFRFVNKGKLPHEYNVALLKEGVTVAQYIDAVNKKVSVEPLRDGPLGVLFAEPGQSSPSFLTADMLPGRTYAVQCIFTDSANVLSHRELGMFKGFVVRNNAAPPTVAVVVDTIVGTDYAYTKYPRTLTPGWHHFAFVNAGKQRHEINVAMLKEGVTAKQLLEAKDEDVNKMIDQALGVLHAESGVTPLGTLDFEVLPGREYVLICTFADTPKSPPHFVLGMVSTMVASN